MKKCNLLVLLAIMVSNAALSSSSQVAVAPVASSPNKNGRLMPSSKHQARAAGTYADPKFWNEESFPGAIHKGDNGYFESNFTGSAGPPKNWYFPVAGSSNAAWTWRGAHAGTYTDPKSWSEESYPGAIHKGDNGYFESNFTGSAGAPNYWYYPAAGNSSAAWAWRGAHAGTFQDPKAWNETTYIGAIHGTSQRVEAKFNGVAGPTHVYPENSLENTWWKVRAVACPFTLAIEPSHFASKQKFISGGQIDMATLVTKGSTKTSPLLKGLVLGRFSSWYQHGDYEMSSAMLNNEKNQEAGSISVVLKNDGSFYALLESPAFYGAIRGNSNGEQTLMPEKPLDHLQQDMVMGSTDKLHASAAMEPDVDCNGTNIVDVLAGFSQEAAQFVGGNIFVTAYALLQIESANLSLRNSHVDNVRLRLVGVQVIPQNYPITTETLNRVSTLFGQEAGRLKADLITAYFASTAEDTAYGWGNVSGRYSIQWVKSPTTFPHEIAHNAGGSHCNTNGSDNYKFGYNNGSSATILCGTVGSRLTYYSTPLISVNGKAIGDARTADMARLWREQAVRMSSYQKAVTPVAGIIP